VDALTQNETTPPLPVSLPGLRELLAETTGDTALPIAVLDGPADLAHPCFQGAHIETLPTMVSEDRPHGLSHEHGTFVASLLFGQPRGPLSGIAPGCRGLLLPIFGQQASGELQPASQTDLARAIVQALSAGARIINVSGGELSDAREMAYPLANAVRRVEEEGAILVAAAGNDGCRCFHVPAVSPSVLVVGSADEAGAPSAFSNFAGEYASHGLLAPGENVLGALPGGLLGRRTGTSFATPIVSGVLALLFLRERRRGRTTSLADLQRVVLESAEGCVGMGDAGCDRIFRGVLSIPRALLLLDSRSRTTMSTSLDTPVPSIPIAVSPPIPDAGSPSLGAVAPSAIVPPADPAKSAAPREEPSQTSDLPAPAGVLPSDCGCGSGKGALVFVLGTLGFDFASATSRDAIFEANGGPIYTNADMAAYLTANPTDAAAIVWTLRVNDYPTYALRAAGPYADLVYERLTSFLADPAIERVAVPGFRRAASEDLLYGHRVEVIEPSLSGLTSWSTLALLQVLFDDHPPPAGTNVAALHHEMKRVLDRVYGGMKNPGITGPERAQNFAVTNAYATYRAVSEAFASGLVLQQVLTERSPLCRPESDCWDVVLYFADPLAMTRSRRLFRFTVDVSDVEPVQIGATRSWLIQ